MQTNFPYFLLQPLLLLLHLLVLSNFIKMTKLRKPLRYGTKLVFYIIVATKNQKVY